MEGYFLSKENQSGELSLVCNLVPTIWIHVIPLNLFRLGISFFRY